MTKINILLNGENFSIENEATLEKLINDLELDITKVAVEKNLEIIDPLSFDKCQIKEGDKIEIVHFIGGG